MIIDSSYDRAVALVRLRTDVVVFLYLKSDPLCTRARSTLSLFENKLRSRGYKIVAVPVNEFSSHYDETSCVRVPQLRFYSRGRLRSKVTGIFSYQDLERLVEDL